MLCVAKVVGGVCVDNSGKSPSWCVVSQRASKVSFNYNGRQELVTLVEIPLFPIFYFL